MPHWFRLTFVFVIACAARAQETSAEAAKIRMDKKALTFPNGKTVALGKDAAAAEDPHPSVLVGAVSPSGKMAAVLDSDKWTITVYDATAKAVQVMNYKVAGDLIMEPQDRFAYIDVSDKGTTVASGHLQRHVMEDPMGGASIAVYDIAGKRLKVYRNLPIEKAKVAFLDNAHDGDIAIIPLPGGSIEQVHPNGDSYSRKFTFDANSGPYHHMVGALATNPDNPRVLTVSVQGVGRPGSLPTNRIVVYGLDAIREWTQVGEYYGQGTLGTSDVSNCTYMVGANSVTCYDHKKAMITWRRKVGHPDLGTISTQIAKEIYVGRERFVTAHLAPTGPGWRVVYSVFKLDGTRVRQFTAKSDGISTNSFLSDQVSKQFDGPYWTISKDRSSLTTLTSPKQTISLISK